MKAKALCLLCLPLILVLLSACLGPKPVLQSKTVTPPDKGSGMPYKIDVVIANQGPGDGQVEVVVNLTNKQTHETLAQDSKQVDLAYGETQHVPFSIDLPESAKDLDPASIDVDVQANYPQ